MSEERTVMEAIEGLEIGEMVVGPACDADLGNWVCITHQLMVADQLQLQSHTEEGTHLVAWHCHEHGLETPGASPPK